jgi:hypothetical protein
VQALRTRSDRELLAQMTARFDAGAIDAPLVRAAGPLLEAYARLVARLAG